LKKILIGRIILLFVKRQNKKNPKLTKPNLKLSAANGDESKTIALLVTNAEAHNKINNIGNNRNI
tara:strand:- start:128 stop:322 length:195 start_codon:yes stop_codon:yes gene_type:complete